MAKQGKKRGYKRITEPYQYLTPLGSAKSAPPKPQSAPFGSLGTSFGVNSATLGSAKSAPPKVAATPLPVKSAPPKVATTLGPVKSAPHGSGQEYYRAKTPSSRPLSEGRGGAGQEYRYTAQQFVNFDFWPSALTGRVAQDLVKMDPNFAANITSFYTRDPRTGLYQLNAIGAEANKAAAGLLETEKPLGASDPAPPGKIEWRRGYASFGQGKSSTTGRDRDLRNLRGKRGGGGGGDDRETAPPPETGEVPGSSGGPAFLRLLNWNA